MIDGDDDTPWRVFSRPRQTMDEFLTSLPRDWLPPLLKLHWMRRPVEDEIFGRVWISVLMPAECWRDWMDPNYQPQLAITAGSTP